MEQETLKTYGIVGQEETMNKLIRLFKIFANSDATIRPHFILTGPTGAGKSLIVSTLCETLEIEYLKVNCASITREGTSGNSISKVLAPLKTLGGKKAVVFFDEFDKLFIQSASNGDLANEHTTGVQQELLTLLEDKTSSVFGDYGKYIEVRTDNILFVFAGAFNGEENIDITRLRELGLRDEFLGRCGLVYNIQKLSLDALVQILKESELLNSYCFLFNKNVEDVVKILTPYVEEQHTNNMLGARMVNTIIHQYFINGKVEKKQKTVMVPRVRKAEPLDF